MIAKAVFLTGYWRSGTNATVAALGRSNDVAVYNEGNTIVFENWRIKDLEIVRNVCRKESRKVALFKPVCEPYRIREYLNFSKDSQVIFLYRLPVKVCRSGLKNFPNWPKVQRSFIENFFSTKEDIFSRYNPQSANKIRFELKDVYSKNLNDSSIIILRWIISNKFFLKSGFASNSRVLTLSYEDLTEQPKAVFRKMSSFIDINFEREIIENIKPSARHDFNIDIDDRVRELARQCYLDLDAISSFRREPKQITISTSIYD